MTVFTPRNRIWFLLTVLTAVLVMTTSLLNAMSAQAWLPDAPATDVGGLINSDTTWTLAGSPYVLTSDLTVAAGVTLTIEPGVVVMGQSTAGLLVNGHLQAIGTETQPITFTSAANTGAGEWCGIDFDGGDGRLEHAIVRYAGQYGLDSITIAGQSTDGPVTIANSVIQDNLAYPILVAVDGLHRLQMSNLVFSDNTKNRVFIDTNVNFGELINHVTLSAQPGLEGYESNGFHHLTVPPGITLTLNPGVTFMTVMNNYINVVGHLEAVGTATKPITFTSVLNSAPDEWTGIVVQGSAHLDYAVVRYGYLGVEVFRGTSVAGGTVLIENSTLSNTAYYPILTTPETLHRLQMNNVVFTGNAKNRVYIETSAGAELISDVTLSAQPGLEGYELNAEFPLLTVPPGITLTLDPGVTFLATMDGYINVMGHLEAAGTVANPITFTSKLDPNPGEWIGVLVQGSAHFDQAQFRNGLLNVDVMGATGGPMLIENSVISDSAHYGMSVYADALHRLQMSNVTFSGANRHILIDNYNNSLVADATLSNQTGLEGYEVGTLNFPTALPRLVVPTGITLTMEAGTTLKSVENGEVVVSGHLEAAGTAVSPVTFTSITDTLPGEWDGLVISGTVNLNHAIVRNGQRNLDVRATAGAVSITHSIISQASKSGMQVEGGKVTAVCTTFTNNSGDAIYVAGSPDVTVFSSSISGNGSGVNNVGGTAVDARQNWWGDVSGPGGVGPGSGDAIWGNVMYDPWLNEPTCTLTPYQLFLPVVIGP